MNDRLVWIDCEMTGLDIEQDALIEIACVVTDADLNLLDDGIDVIIKPPAEALDQMVAVVREMHATSGLLDRAGRRRHARGSRGRGARLREAPRPRGAQGPALRQLDRHRPRFLARDMPELDDWLHYRMIDVSSVKELARRWYPRVYFAPRRSTAGTARSPTSPRACGSCATTGDAVFVPQPGPDSATARAIAARYAQRPSRERPRAAGARRGRRSFVAPLRPLYSCQPSGEGTWWV